MTRELDEDQKFGVKWLADRKYALLADKPGLGKTCQAIVAADIAMHETVLIICPAAVTEHWKREISEMCGKSRKVRIAKKEVAFLAGHTYIMSYNTATDAVNRDRKQLALAPITRDWDLVVIDEVHYLKNPESGRSKAVWGWKNDLGIIAKAGSVWCLSGTPSPNNPLELYPMVKNLFAKHFLRPDGRVLSKTDFIARYCKTKRNGFGIKIVGGKNLDDLKARLAPVMIRRERKGWKQPRITNLYLDCKPELRALQGMEDINMWMELEEALQNAADDKHRALILKGIDQSLQRKMRRHLGLAKVGAAVAWAKEQLESGTEKLVLFGYHTEVLNQMKAELSKATKVAFVDGSVTNRDAEAQKFKNDPAYGVFIGQTTAAGTGLDGLQGAEDLLVVEYSWVPGENEQVIRRLDRRGATGNLLARYAVVAGTMDEQILATVMRKEETINKIYS